MYAKRFIGVGLAMLGLLVLLPAPRAAADCGSVPFFAPRMIDFEIRDYLIAGKHSPAGRKELDFDPLKVSVFEPQQRALILWNGKEEILLLSTDQSATRKSAVLEVIPLPAEPKVRLGSFATFEAAQRLVVEKRMWACAHGGAKADLFQVPEAGRIAFHEKLGAHDVTVAEVLDDKGFVDFVQKHLKDKYQTPEAPIRPEFVRIIDSYLKEGFTWFAFDVIVLDDKTQSRQPIEYRFASERVFYPLRISSLERGKTKVDLLVFSSNGAGQFEGLARKHFDVQPRLQLATKEVETLDKEWKGFFADRTQVAMDQWAIQGKSSKLVSDVKVK
jgi:hypothetical protein